VNACLTVMGYGVCGVVRALYFLGGVLAGKDTGGDALREEAERTQTYPLFYG